MILWCRRWLSRHADSIGLWVMAGLFWAQFIAVMHLVMIVPRGGYMVPGQPDMLSAYPYTPKPPPDYPEFYPEPMMCLWLTGGKVVYCRTEAGGRVLALISRDGGETYEEIPPDDFPNPTKRSEP